MLKRKIYDTLISWKNDSNHKPLIIKGCRQCGKTYIVRKFAEAQYGNIVYINFFENPGYSDIFAGSLEIDNITMMVSATLNSEIKFIPRDTVFIFDEIQECPEARTSLKFFKEDGRYDVICTGSLLGVEGYGTQPKSIPVGSETVLEMNPLDFEEFLWANGLNDNIIKELNKHLKEETPVQLALHNKMKSLLLQYIVVGGMPEAVQSFINNKNLYDVLKIQRDIVSSYESDMVKYAERAYKSQIKDCFRSIPKQLAKENKKFQYSVIKKGSTSLKFKGCLKWIEDANIISRCYNLSITELPLDGNAINDVFKVYVRDTGLFISMLEEGTQADILRGNLLSYKGAIFENIIADFFIKMGRPLYYYHKDSGLEIDFVIRYKGKCTLVEVKSTTGNTKSTRTILKHPEKYNVYNAIKLGDYNIGRKDEVLTLPLYMGFLLTEF